MERCASICPQKGANTLDCADNGNGQGKNLHGTILSAIIKGAHADVSRIQAQVQDTERMERAANWGCREWPRSADLRPQWVYRTLPKGWSGMEGAGEASQFVAMVKGVDYIKSRSSWLERKNL